MKFNRFVYAALFVLTAWTMLLSPDRTLASEAAWSGFYAGGTLGYGFGTAGSGLAIADGPVLKCHFCDNVLGGGPTVDHLIAQEAGSPDLKSRGFSGGLRTGYNWQIDKWVYGIEADFSAFRQRASTDTSFILPGNTALAGGGGVCGATGPETCIGNFSSKLSTDWLLSFRPRIGHVYGNTLVYGTGGLAVTRLSFEQSYTDNITYPLVAGSTGAGGSMRMSSSVVRAGWIIGAGIEQHLQDHWSLSAEYLYMRFKGVSTAALLTDGFGSYASFSNDLDHASFSLVRVGLNYRFGNSRP